MRHATIAALTGLLALTSAGCSQKKITQCNALVQVINAGVVSLEKAPKGESDPSGVAGLRAMADAMDKVAADAGNVQLTVPELKKLRDDYQKMARDIARAERDLAKLAADRDAQKRTAAEATLDAAVKQEDPLVEQINKFCQSP